jgi:hypothetical protein
MADTFALARTPMFDQAGNMARAWVLYFGNQVGLPVVIIDKTLTAASTTITPPIASSNGARSFVAVPAADLIYIIRQDATGGRTIVWGAGFSGASANIDTTASTISTFRFVLSGGLYVMVGQPTTGMTP